jgi:hypothetical protein
MGGAHVVASMSETIEPGDIVRVVFTPKTDDTTVAECAGELAEVLSIGDLYEIRMLNVEDPETGEAFEMGVTGEMVTPA